MRTHATGLGSAQEVTGETRSSQGVTRFRGEVKSWPPQVGVARPGVCWRCGQPAYEGGRVRVQGHGVVARQQRGPAGVGQPPRTQVSASRRYRCTGCGAVMTVLPAPAQPRKHFSGAAISLALALWGLCGWSAARVREAVSDWVHTGASARGWRSLSRWARQVARGRLFGALPGVAEGGARQVAARAAQMLSGHAPPEVRGQGLGAQAFAGACRVG